MKKIILIILSIVTLIVLIYLDSKLYYYGQSWFDIYHPLPLKLTPVFRHDFEGGFAIEDQDGFYVISKGTLQYVGSDQKIEVQEILNYGFKNDELIANIIDSNNEKYQISLKQDHSEPGRLIPSIQKRINNAGEDYYWVQIDSNQKQIRRQKLLRNYLLMFSIVIFLVILWYKIK
ncbi:MAG: hypothetical protein KY428_08625, partial [Bacteroidetes bacterium]|nr:hypothetical protein [Bacteroidota bacterium]